MYATTLDILAAHGFLAGKPLCLQEQRVSFPTMTCFSMSLSNQFLFGIDFCYAFVTSYLCIFGENCCNGERHKYKCFNCKEFSEGFFLDLVSLNCHFVVCRWNRWVSCLLLWSLWCSTTDRPLRSWRSFLANWVKGQCHVCFWKIPFLLYLEVMSPGSGWDNDGALMSYNK